MYSVVLAAMLTAGPTAAPAWGHGCHGCCGGYNAFSSSCCCGGYTSCCGGYSSCCGGYSSCCGGYVASYGCCGGHHAYWGSSASSYSGYGAWGSSAPYYSGYATCFGCCGGSSCCGGWYPAYGSWSGGAIVSPATAAPEMPKTPEVIKEKREGAAAPAPALVVIKAPLDVHISVNGQPTDRTAAEQTFTTPDLEPGRAFSYDFKAEAVRDGKTVTATKKVIVKAGMEVQADFSDLSRSDSSAHVIIKAPADARVTVDGVEIPASARAFNTPALEAGRTYYYTVKMEETREGRMVSDSRHVLVEAGKDVSVKFEEPGVATAGK